MKKKMKNDEILELYNDIIEAGNDKEVVGQILDIMLNVDYKKTADVLDSYGSKLYDILDHDHFLRLVDAIAASEKYNSFVFDKEFIDKLKGMNQISKDEFYDIYFHAFDAYQFKAANLIIEAIMSNIDDKTAQKIVKFMNFMVNKDCDSSFMYALEALMELSNIPFSQAKLFKILESYKAKLGDKYNDILAYYNTIYNVNNELEQKNIKQVKFESHWPTYNSNIELHFHVYRILEAILNDDNIISACHLRDDVEQILAKNIIDESEIDQINDIINKALLNYHDGNLIASLSKKFDNNKYQLTQKLSKELIEFLNISLVAPNGEEIYVKVKSYTKEFDYIMVDIMLPIINYTNNLVFKVDNGSLIRDDSYIQTYIDERELVDESNYHYNSNIFEDDCDDDFDLDFNFSTLFEDDDNQLCSNDLDIDDFNLFVEDFEMDTGIDIASVVKFDCSKDECLLQNRDNINKNLVTQKKSENEILKSIQNVCKVYKDELKIRNMTELTSEYLKYRLKKLLIEIYNNLIE